MKIVTPSVHRKRDRLVTYLLAIVRLKVMKSSMSLILKL